MDTFEKPAMPDKLVGQMFKNLQKFLKTTIDKSPQAVITFLKKNGLSDPQIKYFIARANRMAYTIEDPNWEKKQKQAAVFAKLPKWAQYGMSKVGINPTGTSKLK